MNPRSRLHPAIAAANAQSMIYYFRFSFYLSFSRVSGVDFSHSSHSGTSLHRHLDNRP